MNTQERFAQWLESHRRVSAVDSAMAHLRVDRKAGRMPAANGEVRAYDGKVLAEIHHGMMTAPAYVDTTRQLAQASDLTPPQSACIRYALREIEKTLNIPVTLAAALDHARTRSETAWEQAKAKADFTIVREPFAELVRLKREQAKCLARGGDLYAALLDHYVPGASTQWMLDMVQGLVTRLRPLIENTRGKTLLLEILGSSYDGAEMFALQQNLARRMGFDPTRGGFIRAEHPFTCGFTPNHVELAMSRTRTTMFEEVLNMLHEGGHGIANQGYPTEWWYTPMTTGPSHIATEAEAKILETGVGRMRSFWQYYFPVMQERFPSLMGGAYTWWHAYQAVNRVQPSFIRVDADPVTYHSHILLRLLLEILLINEEMPVAEVPSFWNRESQRLLGITPGNDAEGCLQDDHEYDGCFGYFGSYSGAEVVGVQWFGAVQREISLDEYFSSGRFPPIDRWMTEQVFQHGTIYTTEELVRRGTGSDISVEPLVRLLTERVNEVYNL